MEKIKLGPQTFLYPMPAMAIRKERYTLKGVQEHGTFSINVASSSMVKKVDYCGIYSGKNTDKSQIFTPFYSELKTAPLIEECPVNLECKAIHYLDTSKYHRLGQEIAPAFKIGKE